MSANLLHSREGRVARLTLNRPEKRNALDMALCRALLEALEDAGADTRVGAILLDGAGPGFCAGMDLAEVLDAPVEDLIALHQSLFSVRSRLHKPVVAVVHGAALAGGLGLALNAHVVVAASDARFGLTETRIGLWPYMIFRAVAEAVGERRAAELALTARVFDAHEARRIGLVDFIREPAHLPVAALELAAQLAAGSAEAAAAGLAFVAKSRALDGEAERELAAAMRRRAHVSADFHEGVRAFLEKRRPSWPSHHARQGGAA